MWSYELRRGNKVIDKNGGYHTEAEAKHAGERARLWMEEIHYPYERLQVIVQVVAEAK
jgi:hypothetical protein